MSAPRRGRVLEAPIATNRPSSTNGSGFRFAARAQRRGPLVASPIREAQRSRPLHPPSIDRLLSRENWVSLGSSDRAFQ